MDENKNLPELPPEENEKKRRINWNKKYTTIAVYALFVILFAVVFVFFFLNNHEVNRMTVNVNVSERAVEEIYLPAFEKCVTP